MPCDPLTAVQAAKCFECMDVSEASAVAASLLCEWASGTNYPEFDYRITDDGSLRMTDDGTIRIVTP